MSIKSVTTDLTLHLKPSKFLTIIVILSFFIAISSVIVLAMDLHWPVFLLFIPVICQGTRRTLLKECLRTMPAAIVYCSSISARKWRICNRAGKTMMVKIAGRPFRSQSLVVLPFITLNDAQRITVILPYDAIPSHDYTRLLSRLWGIN